MHTKKAFLRSAVVVYFIIAFEVLIMISPFAGFFYSVFNPVLLQLASHPATRWLSAFFLPHMVLPGDGVLVALRITGSGLFLLGMLLFFACAFQIYASKLMKRGAVLGGLYSWIRHPQYLALGIAGIGLSILWPRFLTAVLWLVMAFIYYFLAKDEERRMLTAYAGSYRDYMNRTGMFFPAILERVLTPSSRLGKGVLALGFSALAIGTPFLLRAYTVRHLTLWAGAPNAAVLAILPEDGPMMDHRMGDVLELEEVRSRMKTGKHYLVYFLPREYIMQGMIADTGGDWKLFEQHRSLSMITDWVINPFGHLRGGHHAMHAGMKMPVQGHASEAGGVVRRLIFLSIEGTDVGSPADLFSIRALRIPEFMMDVDIHNLRILGVKELAHGSGWGTVPTPMF
jgi:protein-S-isoprenylcysteine O-methyltransferase Ste14